MQANLKTQTDCNILYSHEQLKFMMYNKIVFRFSEFHFDS